MKIKHVEFNCMDEILYTGKRWDFRIGFNLPSLVICGQLCWYTNKCGWASYDLRLNGLYLDSLSTIKDM